MSESKLLSSEAKTMSNGSESVKQAASTRTRRSWKEIKTTVEFSRKLMFALNTDSPSNIVFGGGQKNCERVYYLGGTRKRDVTIKYIDVASGGSLGEKLVGEVLLEDSYPSSLLDGSSQRQLTKEEQLLRERKRCSFNGITSFCLDQNRQRLVFSENSDLFYFDDFGAGNSSTEKNISTASKGALDVKICPNNADLISYILNDNVYVQDLVSKREFKLTSSADPVKSGVPSYAVQEEFNRYTGYWWQPQQSSSTTYRIVYEEVDDGCVDLIYISPSCESEFGVDTYRYPKAGTKNSRTELRMAEFTFSSDPSGKPTINCKLKRMQKSFYDLFSWYEYLVRGEWTPDGQYFWALIYDRLQQRGRSMLIPVEFFVPIDSESHDQAAAMETSSYLDETKHIILLEEQTSDSWINFHNTIYFLNQQSDEKKPFSYVTALEDTGYLHLYLFKLSLQAADLELITDGVLRSKSLEKIQLTSGDWCVEYNENVNVDEANGFIYFTGYKDPLESHLYVVNYNEPNKIRQLTSNGYSHKITMNKKCNYFITICSNLSTQQKTYVYELSNQRKSVDDLVLKQVAQIVSREELKSSAAATASTVTVTTAPSVDAKTSSAELNSYYTSVNSLLGLNLDALAVSNPSLDNNFAVVVQHLFKPPQIFTFTTDDGCKLYGMIYMPHNYEHGNKYPTMLYIYGGPKVQLVNNSYKANKYPRFNILALLGYCVVIIDSRGSDYRGKVFETHLNRKMGTVEISDQVKGLECAARVFNCIDMKRVAIFGWSYGGYMALMGLAQRPDIFKLGISGAPVTTWNLYDTAYTERYMGLPNENRKAYEDGSVLSWAKSFPDEENRLLIIHGMIDENVHFAHTRKLIDALIKENKPYQLQVYPNERHGIRSSDASLHCDINLYSFLEQHL